MKIDPTFYTKNRGIKDEKQNIVSLIDFQLGKKMTPETKMFSGQHETKNHVMHISAFDASKKNLKDTKRSS